MGKKKDNPRYSVLSTRVSAELFEKISLAAKREGISRSEWLAQKLMRSFK